MTTDESIAIVDYDSEWPAEYLRERSMISETLGDVALSIEHIGSTAVPGMPAKPIVDIQIGVRSFPTSEKRLQELTRLGYEPLGEAGVPERLYFRKRQPTQFNVHVVIWKGEHWNNNIVLRDYLRLHSDEALRYADSKRRAVIEGAGALLHYSQRKGPLINNILERARRWAKAQGMYTTRD